MKAPTRVARPTRAAPARVVRSRTARAAPAPPRAWADGVLDLGRAAGNAAVASVVTGRRDAPAPLQRHFIAGLHLNTDGHLHTRQLGDQFLGQATKYSIQINDLLKNPVTHATATELDSLRPILVSHQSALVTVKAGHKETLTKVTGLVKRIDDATAGWRRENEEREAREVGQEFAGPALAAVIELEGFAATGAAAAEAALKAGTSATSAAQVEGPAAKAATASEHARLAHQRILELAGKVTSEAGSVKATIGSYIRAGGRGLDLARRMAALADDALSAWKAADVRKASAEKAIDDAKADVIRFDQDVANAKAALAHLEGFAASLIMDVAEWRTLPNADPRELVAMLSDVGSRLAAAHLAKGQAEDRLRVGRAKVVEITDQESKAVGDATQSATGLASARAGEATSGADEAHRLSQLRLLAGGVEEAERLLVLVPDPSQLTELLTALGADVAKRWLDAADIGRTIALGALGAFGAPGLTDLVKGVADTRLRPLLANPGPARLAELVNGLGLAKVDALAAAGFSPSEVEAFVAALDLKEFSGLLDQVEPSALKAMGVAATKLATLLAQVPAADVGALVGAVGPDKAKGLIAAFEATRLKAILADLPPDALAHLDTTANHLKGLLTDFIAKELNDFGLTGAQFKAVLPGVNAAALRALAADITYLRVKQLVVAFPAGADIKTLIADVGNAGQTRLLDLFTQFTAEEMRDYRTTVGLARFKVLLIDKALPAAALSHYGADMLKTFIGVGNDAWKHATTAKISATSGQISGAHDEKAFFDFLNAQQPGAAKGEANGRITRSDPPGAIYKVEYKLHANRGKKKGSKTLIRDLDDHKDTWMASFNDAVWSDLRASTFSTASGFATGAAAGQAYEWFYASGKEVDTIYPL